MSKMCFDFEGKNVLITGAERGIGLEIAKGFAKCGANIIIAGIMNDEFPNAEKLIKQEGAECVCVHTDISDEVSVKKMVNTVKEKFERIDILVNNAGINKLAPAEEMPLEVWQRIINVNFTGTFIMCREIGSIMIKQGGGNIVNIASMSGLVVNPLPQQQCAYNSSKAGVIMLTKCLANEWAEKGIRVNAVCPGFTRTPLTAKRLDTPNDPAVKKWIGGTPMNRVANPDEMVGIVLYYASEFSSFTTGTCIPIDGGYTCL
ncbi:MAG: SDR family oxidoreductase [Clostridiales bacterium]|nr:SDR family oxidoreductase [Clostridiales bacterium]